MLGIGVSRRARRNLERGSAAVEFALVLPIFCAIVFGTIDYGWYFYQRFTLTSAVRDGLRAGVVISQTITTSPNDCASVAKARAAADLTQAGLTGTSSFTTSTAGSFPTKTLTLNGTYTFTPLINFVPLPKNNMTYSLTMMFELQQ